MHFDGDYLGRFCGILRAIGRGALKAMPAALLAIACEQATAQQLPLPGITPDQMQQLQNRMGAGLAPEPVTPRETILEPNAPENPVLPQSRLEQILSERAGTRLREFGYEYLGVGRPVTLPQVGAMQDSYVLGPGDEIIVSLRGQENSEYRTTVDRDGRIILPRLNPVPAAGRTLGQFRRDLLDAVHRAYVSTEAYVTVGRLRQVSVMVSGEVRSPGVRTLTGLSTAVDAILVSGGVRKTGSLRNIRILRGGREITVDLYSVLTTGGRGASVALADGDRIIVPPLGRTAAVVGWVRRQGIYELPAGRSAISTRDLISLAGGLEVRGKYRMSVLRVAADGRNQLIPLEREEGTIGDSDILFVQPAASQTTSMATLSGGTALAGKYATHGTKLSELLKSPGALGENPYTMFGVISRKDPVTLLRILIPFTPVAVLRGSQDLEIQSDDIVRVISTDEARVLFFAVQEFRIRRSATQEALINPQSAREPVTGLVTGTPGGSTGQDARARVPNAAGGQQSTTADASAGAPASVMALQQQRIPQEMGAARDIASLLSHSGNYSGQAERQALSSSNNSPLGEEERVGGPTQNVQGETQTTGSFSTNLEVKRVSDLASQLRVDPLVLMNFLDDRAVNVDGAVQGPGLYLVGPDADIQAVLAAAGGLARWADRSAIEVISTTVDANNGRSQTARRTVSLAGGADAAYIVSPRDEVRVNEVYTAVGIGSVTIQGQIRHVGTYQIVRGERLSDLLMRAGGLTETAYPYGTVFLRRSVALREQDAFQREAGEIENQLLMAMSRREANAKLSPDAFTALQSYIVEIRNQRALGRIVVTADPAVLAANPASDPLLEPGDIVFVPQRPYSVSVLGQVLQPGSVPFTPGMTASDYIGRAGGYSQFADDSETILVLPDGSARRVERSWFSFSSDSIPPGSTIFVARDVSGVDLHQIIVDTTAIVSQLAVSAASLAILSTQVK